MKVTTVQKWWRFRLFRKSMDKYINAAQKIQATFKAHLLRGIFKNVQGSIKIIQRVVKKHLSKKYKIGKLWKGSNDTLK